MDRSAIDATRFTATSPHAYSKPTPPRGAPSSSSSSPPKPPPGSGPRFQSPTSTPKKSKFQSPTSPSPLPSSSSSNGPAGETPQQKVARLRAARAAQRYQLSLWDIIVLRGRVVADKLHRATVTGLIGFTVITGVITVYALGDMIIYNRRKRASYYAQKAAERQAALQDAIDAEKASRPLSESQAALLNLERARLAAEDERARRKWGVRKLGDLLVRGLKGEDDAWKEAREAGKIVDAMRAETAGAEGTRGEGSSGSGEASSGPGEASSGPGEANSGQGDVDRQLDPGNASQQQQGGSLDRMAARAAQMVRLKTGWGSGDAGK